MKIGFLPLYIKLYDDSGSTARDRLEPFYETLASAFEQKGLEVVRSPLCRVKSEFEAAVASFEANGADAIVTWHAAYSPSLESIDALTGTDLPLIVLDTTETYDFSPLQSPDEIGYCHGIHGVMDMCSMLARRGKPYAIAAGHYPTSDVLDRAVGFVRAAVAARSVAGSSVGLIGRSFPGMGDFLISDEEIYERFGVRVVRSEAQELRELKNAVTDAELDAEIAADLEGAVRLNEISDDILRLTERNCLAVRRWLEKHGLDAFTVDFMDISPELGLDTMPFMEACKAMSRGIGYAGEGDILTAVLTGAALRGFGDASFVEIFCPDWKNGSLFLSHMGEINYNVAGIARELKRFDFIYGDAEDPVIGYTRFRSGRATFANLFAGPDGFRLLTAPVTMEEPDGEDRFTGCMRGWMRPEMPVPGFLERLSSAGATHHSVLIYGAAPEQLAFFGRLLGLEVIPL